MIRLRMAPSYAEVQGAAARYDFGPSYNLTVEHLRHLARWIKGGGEDELNSAEALAKVLGDKCSLSAANIEVLRGLDGRRYEQVLASYLAKLRADVYKIENPA